MRNGYPNRPRDEIAEMIECYIINNNIKENERLPSERDLCAMWKVNRTTLRSAVNRLIEEGIIYNKLGAGTYVASPKIELNLQDMRGFKDIVSKAGRSSSIRVIGINILETSKQIGQKLQLPLGHRVMELVRVRYIDDVPILIENAYISAHRFAGIEKYDYSKVSLYHTLEETYGIRLVKGNEKINVTYANSEEGSFLEIEENTPVIYRCGKVYDDKDQIVEYFSSITRMDKVKFVSMLIKNKSKIKGETN